MAELVSPGVSVTVTDESFYAPAGTGTVPLIVIATAENKATPDGTGTAPFTVPAEAGKLKLITSQRELLQAYGNPIFYKSGGTPQHGYELNEYGLQAAYSFLGIANRAYVLRADVDLGLLTPSATPPGSLPADGLLWLNMNSSETFISIKEYDGSANAWVLQSYRIPNASEVDNSGKPKSSFGVDLDYAVTYLNDDGTSADIIQVWRRNGIVWNRVGSSGWATVNGGADFQFATHTNVPSTQSDGSTPLADGDVYIQVSRPNQGSFISISEYDRASNSFSALDAEFYANSRAAYDSISNLVAGDLFVEYGLADGEAEFRLRQWNGNSTLVAQSSAAISEPIDLSAVFSNAAEVAFSIAVDQGTAFNVNFDNFASNAATVDDIVGEINREIGDSRGTASNRSANISASNVNGQIAIIESNGRDIELLEGNVSGWSLSNLNFIAGQYSNWEAVEYEANRSRPVGDTEDGAVWYDNVIDLDNLDIVEKTNGGVWQTYPGDIQITATTAPTTNSSGSALSAGDLWIDSGDLENYPVIYKWDGADWNLIDNTDQETSEGIIFADFRAGVGESLDSDAPDADLYPVGILGWNKRASGGNVREWDEANSRWVDASGNKIDGSPYMLRKAQRQVVVRAMQSALVSNSDLRNETNRYNLIAAPGYTETVDEMIALNVDRKETAFILVDPPFRLESDAISIQQWANNSNNASENGDAGLLSASPYAGVYYPHGLSTALDGSNIFVPASHMALRTLAFNDQVAFPWFAPAGFQRGLVNNATSVGYIDPDTGEFVPVSLNEGQRDSLYINKINPIANFPGRGLAVFGQKTLNPSASALDRVNVARLVVYIREQLDDIVRPFLFEPNDEVTRSNAKTVVDRFLGQLVTQRGLFDFVVVCDETNNTPARIDRNELHIDIAIQPVKAVEFIYIPIRIQNTLGQTG